MLEVQRKNAGTFYPTLVAGYYSNPAPDGSSILGIVLATDG